MGRKIATVYNTGNLDEQRIEVSALRQGTYVLTSFGDDNNIVSVAKFIKY